MHLINISALNAQIIEKKEGGKLDTLDFRTKLVEQIVEKYGTIAKSSVESRGGETQFRRKPLPSNRKTFVDTNSTYR